MNGDHRAHRSSWIRRLLAVATAALLGVGVTCGMGCATAQTLLDQLGQAEVATIMQAPSRPRPPMATYGIAPSLTPELKALAARVTPSLVELTSYDRDETPIRAGTGVVLNSDGLVVTNYHVVMDAAQVVATRSLHDDRTYNATVLGADPARDIAVLRLRGGSKLPAADLGDSSTLRINQRVATIGNGWGRMEIGAGPITQLDYATRAVSTEAVPHPAYDTLYGMIEAQTGSNPNDSGGAMVTTDGTVIGINQGYSFDGRFGYAIPINTALRVVDQLTGEDDAN